MIKLLPIHAVIMGKQNPSEFASSIEVSPVDGGPTTRTGGREDVEAERWIEGGKERKVWWFLGVPIPRVDRRRIDSPPLFALHRSKHRQHELKPYNWTSICRAVISFVFI